MWAEPDELQLTWLLGNAHGKCHGHCFPLQVRATQCFLQEYSFNADAAEAVDAADAAAEAAEAAKAAEAAEAAVVYITIWRFSLSTLVPGGLPPPS